MVSQSPSQPMCSPSRLLVSKWICSWDIWCSHGLMRPRAQKMAHEHIDLLMRQQDRKHMGCEGESQTIRTKNGSWACYFFKRQQDQEHMGVEGEGARPWEVEMAHEHLMVSWSPSPPQNLCAHILVASWANWYAQSKFDVLMVSWDQEHKKWLMSILICSRDDETESTWVGRGSPRPGDHENKKWFMSILFFSQDDKTKITCGWGVLDYEK